MGVQCPRSQWRVTPTRLKSSVVSNTAEDPSSELSARANGEQGLEISLYYIGR